MTTSDSELRGRLAGALGATAADRPQASGGHPDVEQLIAYHQGELPEERHRRVQDHLVACSRCVEDLLELDDLVRPSGETVAADGSTIVEAASGEGFEATAMWRTLARSRAAPTSRRWPLALAASLLFALGGLGLWTLEQGRQLADLELRSERLSRPQLNAAIVDLFVQGAERGRAVEPGGQVVDDGSRFLTLILHLPDAVRPSRSTGYVVEIRDRQDVVVWSGGALRPSRLGTVRLGLVPGFLRPGPYRILLRSGDGANGSPAAVYDLTVPES